MNFEIENRIREVADFLGSQNWPGFGVMELWNLRVPLGRYPVGSTLSRETIVELLESEVAA